MAPIEESAQKRCSKLPKIAEHKILNKRVRISISLVYIFFKTCQDQFCGFRNFWDRDVTMASERLKALNVGRKPFLCRPEGARRFLAMAADPGA